MKIVFFGSFQHYSALVLDSLIKQPGIEIVGVVTTPPKPQGRKQIITKTPVQLLAEEHNLPVFTPDVLDLHTVYEIPHTEFFMVAGYGKLLPKSWLDYPKYGSLNLHFSLLPKYRGANPAEWAILSGETETGITLMTMAETFDTGQIIAQESLPINSSDTRESLYQKLYTLGADKLPDMLVHYDDYIRRAQFPCQKSFAPKPQPPISPTPPAYRFTKDQSFIDWQLIKAAMQGKDTDHSLLPPYLLQSFKPPLATFIERAVRALFGFPGVWTIVPTTKGDQRLKLLTSHLDANRRLVLDQIQLEGHNPTSYPQIKNQIIID